MGGFKEISEEERMELILNDFLDFVKKNTIYETSWEEQFFVLCKNKALHSQLICTLMKERLEISITPASHLIVNSLHCLGAICIKDTVNWKCFNK